MSERTIVIASGETVTEPRVKALDYIGGEGGFCEPLVINIDGEQNYVLHRLGLVNRRESKWDEDDWVTVHEKVEFDSQGELEAAFDEVQRRLTSNLASIEWIETDKSLGFDIPVEEFTDATSRIMAVPWDQRRN